MQTWATAPRVAHGIDASESGTEGGSGESSSLQWTVRVHERAGARMRYRGGSSRREDADAVRARVQSAERRAVLPDRIELRTHPELRRRAAGRRRDAAGDWRRPVPRDR